VIAGVVLAAGASRRFGAVKQLVEVNGTSLLGRAIETMGAVREVDEVVVVLGANAQAIMQLTPLGRARVVVCRVWEEGVSASLRAGLDAVAGAEAAVITLADQPLIHDAAVRRMLAARAPGVPILAASYGSDLGHPVLLEREAFGLARDLKGESGTETLCASSGAVLIPCDDIASPVDIDFPADLARIKA
jgi:molybdenum cofactor cytidylyltransferase